MGAAKAHHRAGSDGRAVSMKPPPKRKVRTSRNRADDRRRNEEPGDPERIPARYAYSVE